MRVQELHTPTWPPAELARSTAGQARAGWFKRPPWPAKDSLEYTRLFVTVALLLLALPYLVGKLLHDPDELMSGLGRRAANQAVK